MSHKTLDKSFESLEFKKIGEEDQEHEAKMNAMVERGFEGMLRTTVT